MAIQFRCPGCSQPIEVDDPFAGKAAQCPYCRRVITVPEQTSFDAGGPIEARPAADATLPPPPPLTTVGGTSYGTYSPADPYGRPPAYATRPAASVHDRGRSGVARVTGNLALILTFAAFGLFIGYMFMLVPALPQMARMGTSQPNAQQAEEMLRNAGVNINALALVVCGMMFCVVAGLVLGIASWWQQPAGNWRAWCSVGINAVFLMCMCFGAVMMFAGAASSGL
jgi:DNA-directed RNA polymerase subunit RPC12/RpoP